MKEIAYVSSHLASFPTLRVTFKVVAQFFYFLEDMWFYKYHNTNYSAFMLLTFKQIETINELKVSPQFLPVEKFENVV